MAFDTIRTAYGKDPALRGGLSFLEVFFYPGVQAIWIYRASNFLWRMRLPLLPRALSYFGRFLTGAEIHPGAKIGKGFFIDHATGVVIGETAEIGENVMMYHQVTLGGRGWWRDEKGKKRHPTVGDNVILGVGATILGPVIIGNNAKIGALALVLEDVKGGETIVAEKGKNIFINGGKTKRKE